MQPKPILTVGVFQAESQGTPRQRLRRLTSLFSDPSNQALDLLVCPELFMSGYFVDDDITVLAQGSNDWFANETTKLARDNHCTIVYGYPERVGEAVYNSALVLPGDGKPPINHRKTLLPTDYERCYFQEGTEPTFFEVQGWRVGLIVCYESEFPESSRYHAQSGCDLVIAPTALVAEWPVVARKVIPTRAFENGIFFVYANFAGIENGNEYLGESVIVSPRGDDLARAGSSETLIKAELDHTMIELNRERLTFLPDARRSRYR